jgi:hypothetical protein
MDAWRARQHRGARVAVLPEEKRQRVVALVEAQADDSPV